MKWTWRDETYYLSIKRSKNFITNLKKYINILATSKMRIRTYVALQ